MTHPPIVRFPARITLHARFSATSSPCPMPGVTVGLQLAAEEKLLAWLEIDLTHGFSTRPALSCSPAGLFARQAGESR